MNKKSQRNSLTNLLSEYIDALEPQTKSESGSGSSQTKPKTKAKSQSKSQPKQSAQPIEKETDLLDRLVKKPKSKTRITLDLEPQQYEQLEKLAAYTGQTKAKLLRSMIDEVAKLLENKQ